MNTSAELDLVIPVYNEAHVLAASVERLRATMLGLGGFSWRIVVIDNGSTDATARIGHELAERLGEVCFLRIETKGRGYALRKTWMETAARFSLYMDVHLSTDLATVGQVIELLRQGADIVTGSRLDRASRITRSWKREILSRGYNRLIRWTLGTRTFDDAQCGFKAIRVESVRPLLPLVENQHWFFDTELLVLAEYAGLAVRTLPIVWIKDPDSRVHIPRTIWEDIQGLRRLRHTARGLVERWREERAALSALRGRKGAAIRNGTREILFPFFWRTYPAASGSTSGQRTGVTSGKLGKNEGLTLLRVFLQTKKMGATCPASVPFCPVTVPICPVTVPICPVTVPICPVISPALLSPLLMPAPPSAICQKKIQN